MPYIMLTTDNRIVSINIQNIKTIFNIKSLVPSHIRYQNRYITATEIASRGNNLKNYKDIIK